MLSSRSTCNCAPGVRHERITARLTCHAANNPESGRRELILAALVSVSRIQYTAPADKYTYLSQCSRLLLSHLQERERERVHFTFTRFPLSVCRSKSFPRKILLLKNRDFSPLLHFLGFAQQTWLVRPLSAGSAHPLFNLYG